MRIVIVGATGYVGSALLTEALARGHEVTALVRDPRRLPQHPRLAAAAADLYDPAAVARAVGGHAAVLCAFSPGRDVADLRLRHRAGSAALLEGVRRAGVPRLLVVGGAGSLEVAPGLQLADAPGFPPEYRETALATRDVLELLRAEDQVRWTFLSPPAELVPGPRTGHYRLGGDTLLVDAQGMSRLSVADYAVAMLDELERPGHDRRRFSVAA
jgi:putative NADH-flavin reductase